MSILGYWKTRGLGQPIRLLLNYVAEDFEDLKYEMGNDFSEEEWKRVKYTLGFEFPNLPYYIDGEMKVTQSNAILRYLGRKYNLVGATETESIMVDTLLNHAMDLRVAIDNVTYHPRYEELKTDIFEKFQKEHLPLLEKRLNTGHTWFIGNKITIVDFPLYEILDNLRVMNPGCLSDFPKITSFLDRFEELPNIKKYMESEKFMKSPINNKFAAFIG